MTSFGLQSCLGDDLFRIWTAVSEGRSLLTNPFSRGMRARKEPLREKSRGLAEPTVISPFISRLWKLWKKRSPIRMSLIPGIGSFYRPPSFRSWPRRLTQINTDADENCLGFDPMEYGVNPHPVSAHVQLAGAIYQYVRIYTSKTVVPQ